MKKLIVLLLLSLSLMSMAQEQAQEQTTELEGTWKFHPTYLMSAATNLIDTEHYVYALTNGALVRWDKVNQQIMPLSTTNGLSDVKVSNIYYNYDKQYLMVTYANSNIDLLYEDGRIVNVSALYDVVMNVSRKINDVTFDGDRALLATDFGLVVLNTSTLQVVEFRQYGEALNSVAQVGEYMVVVYGGNIYASKASREYLNDYVDLRATQQPDWAQTMSFVAGVNKGSSKVAKADAMTKDGVTISSTKAALALKPYVFYQNCNTTISSTVGKITKVAISVSDGFDANLFSGTGYNSETATWTGAAESLTLASSDTVNVDTIAVTYFPKANAAKLYPVNDNTFFVYGVNFLKRCTINSNGSCDITTVVDATANNIQKTVVNGVDGWLANFRSSACFYTIKNDGAFTATKVAGNTSSLFSCSPDGDGTTIWQIDGNGIHVKGKTTYYKPDGIYMRAADVTLFHDLYNPWDGKFYVTSADQNWLIDNVSHKKHILTYDGTQWTDATPASLKNSVKLARITFIPGMPGSYFATDRSNTFYRVINGQLKGTFKNGSTTWPLQYGSMKNALEPGLLVDPQGNLWMISSADNNAVAMLPSDKVLADTVQYSDWHIFDASNFSLYYPQRQLAAATRDGVQVFTCGYQASLFNIWRTKPGATDVTDIDLLVTQDFIDQTGKAIDMKLPDKYALAADSTDNIWVAMRSGLFYFKASEAFNPDFRVTKPIVLAGVDDPYSLETIAIGVDPSNRKWIGTKDSGLFVVSADGSRVLNHFDVDNSALPSSMIYGVQASQERAVVVTSNGIVEFDMNEIPDAIDYTAVTAAPLFVKPDYTGFVTIGQVDVGACVRITDRDGNIVREFTATGNQVAWDTCNESGERVPTGVYNVYAGLTADQLPGTPQVRVKVIK